MGQKINPTGFRLSVNRDWASKWYANSKHFPATLNEDIKVRDYLRKKLSHASVGKITIERPAKNARITIHSARPGVVIGKKGEDIETLRASLRKMMGTEVGLDIEYGFAEAKTTYGVIGIKVWVFKGEVMPHNAEPQAAPEPAPEAPKRARKPAGV